MTNPLFSTYSQPENQVTGTILSVFDHLGPSLVEDIFETALDESDLSVVSFESQFVTDSTTPDAAIRSSTTVYIETKIEPRAVSRTQLEGHLDGLETERSDTKLLVVLTPDAAEPETVSTLSDERVV